MPELLDPAQHPGLSPAEAAARLAADGPNALPQDAPRSWRASLAEALREPMFLLLATCVLVYLLLGDRGEAVLLALMVVAVVGITFVQGRRTERALAALRDLAQPQARVRRGGATIGLPASAVVRGDCLVLAEGERVAADALLLAAANLVVDESLLTGESVPVAKRAARAGEAAPAQAGGDDSPAVYAGTLVVRGAGLATVSATGAASAIGRIGVALRELQPAPSPLQRESRRWVRVVGGLALAVCVLLFVWLGAARGDWLAAALAALALAISLVPEEIPVVMSIFVAMGAWRMARHAVLARRLPAVEAIGAISVLALDKTGTLTENRMSLARLAAPPGTLAAAQPAARHALLGAARLACPPVSADPMERALVAAAAAQWPADPAVAQHRHEYPLAPERLVLTQVWGAEPGPQTVATKGAPEAIVALCRLPPAAAQAALAQAHELAEQGLRVLGVAGAHHTGPLPATVDGFAFEYRGLVGLADPLRADAAAAIARLRGAGIRVLMITGDYPATALAIAREAGIAHAPDCITGAQIDALTAEQLAARVATVDVFARVSPAHKLAIVRALQARGEVVAMTGDGVNDAPALRAANIGVAMGRRGTEVARQAAAVVLLADDFAALVEAVRLGRRVRTNLGLAMSYIIAVHVMIAGVALMPALLGGPLILLPAQIVLLELAIDPACSIAFEAERARRDELDRPPSPANDPLLARDALLWALAAGGAALAAVAGVALALADHATAELRSAVFVAVLLANLLLVIAARSSAASPALALRSAPAALAWVLGLALAGLVLVLGVAPLRSALGFAALDAASLPVVGVAVLGLALTLEALARIRAARGS